MAYLTMRDPEMVKICQAGRDVPKFTKGAVVTCCGWYSDSEGKFMDYFKKGPFLDTFSKIPKMDKIWRKWTK